MLKHLKHLFQQLLHSSTMFVDITIFITIIRAVVAGFLAFGAS